MIAGGAVGVIAGAGDPGGSSWSGGSVTRIVVVDVEWK